MPKATPYIAVIIGTVFFGFELLFYSAGDSHIGTLMCGMSELFIGIGIGWYLYGKTRKN